MVGASGCAVDISAPSRLQLRVRPVAVLNVDLRSTLLTLGNPQDSSVLLSLNRNVNMLIVNSRCLCGFAALKVSQPDASLRH